MILTIIIKYAMYLYANNNGLMVLEQRHKEDLRCLAKLALFKIQSLNSASKVNYQRLIIMHAINQDYLFASVFKQ